MAGGQAIFDALVVGPDGAKMWSAMGLGSPGMGVFGYEQSNGSRTTWTTSAATGILLNKTWNYGALRTPRAMPFPEVSAGAGPGVLDYVAIPAPTASPGHYHWPTDLNATAITVHRSVAM